MNAATCSSQGVIRRARVEDLEAILDLLTEYELPRSYFEPFYLRDPMYRPEHSWVVEQNGRLAAHLRLYDRWIRMHDSVVHVAGVGNVITAQAFRGRGYAGRLLGAMTAAARAEGFAYSLLWTHLPILYERYGWSLIEQRTVRALLSRLPAELPAVASFGPEDLPDIIRLYEATNEHRTGPTLRVPEYWQSQLAWLKTDPDNFLVVRREDGALAGYIRTGLTHADVRILELGVAAQDIDLGRALVVRAAQRRRNHVQARLPPSLLEVIPESERDVEDDSRFMGRVLSLEVLVRALEPVLLRRLEAAGLRNGAVCLATSDGTAELRLGEGRVELDRRPTRDMRACLNEGDLAHLLFHGFDPMATELLDGRSDTELLRTLFPAQDFVVWPADAF